MKTAHLAAVSALLVISLSSCNKRTKTAPPPQAEAPILSPSNMVHIPNLPALPPPPLRDVVIASTPPETTEPVRPHRPARRKPSPAKPATAAEGSAPTSDKSGAAAAPTQTASVSDSNNVSPIGQLSSSGDGSGSPGRPNIERQITDTENGLNGIKRTLSTDEQLTSTQIKTFLTKARQALAENDLDGAQTLANKAKVLLEELTKK